jgi:hypothetical protein
MVGARALVGSEVATVGAALETWRPEGSCVICLWPYGFGNVRWRLESAWLKLGRSSWSWK